ncbi:VWA domain-containing protein [Gordonia paraffinivorans]|nr:VWA domain-containing protein [Gordonia paraffinivorans]
MMTPPDHVRYPFSAVVGQEQLKLALILSAISPGIGGVLIRGEKGTAKSTIVRGLGPLIADEGDRSGSGRVVELPIGATEDRVIGSLDLTSVLRDGRAEFTPGLLARAHHGVLYIDEVNLLADHLVDVLLDAAAGGRVTIERDGVSHTQEADFVLVGTMNPEEGELRPQLLDRFGLAVDVAAGKDLDERVEVVRRRMAFDADPAGFAAAFADAEKELAQRIRDARAAVGEVALPTRELRRIAGVCAHLDVDGLRGDIVVARTAAAHAAWRGAAEVTEEDVRAAVELALPHRRRRNPFDESGLSADELDDAMRSGQEAAGPVPDDRGPDDPGPDDPGPDDPGPDDPGPDDPGPGDGPGGAPAGDGPERSQADSGSAAPAGETDRDETGRNETGCNEIGASAGPAFGTARGAGAQRMRALALTGVGDGEPGRRSKARSRRGLTTRAVDFEAGLPVHLFATVLAAAGRTRPVATDPSPVRVRADDLRAAQRIGQESNLVVFVVDLSGSMTARRRLAAVADLSVEMLRDSYTRRDRVAVVVARGTTASLAVPPTKSVDVAVRRLAEVRTGGRTPLAEGLLLAGEVIERRLRAEPHRRPLLVVLTDGRATAGRDAPARARAAAASIRRRGIESVVVDCEQGMVRLGLAAELAGHLGAGVLTMDELTAGALSRGAA